jgi:hypothetical protein
MRRSHSKTPSNKLSGFFQKTKIRSKNYNQILIKQLSDPFVYAFPTKSLLLNMTLKSGTVGKHVTVSYIQTCFIPQLCSYAYGLSPKKFRLSSFNCFSEQRYTQVTKEWIEIPPSACLQASCHLSTCFLLPAVTFLFGFLVSFWRCRGRVLCMCNRSYIGQSWTPITRFHPFLDSSIQTHRSSDG